MLSTSKREHFSEVGKLALIAFPGHGVIFLINLVLARSLSVSAYEHYVIAAAVFLLMLAVTSQGLDKYALRMMPGKFASKQYGQAARYLRFSISRLLLGAIIVAALTVFWAHELRDFPPEAMSVIYITLLALPFGALTYFLCAAISAAGNCVRAAAVTHLIVPALSLLLICVALLSPIRATGATGVFCWLIAWCLGLALAAYWLKQAWPAASGADHTEQQNISWRAEALHFWFYRLAMSVIAQIPIILLDWLQPSAAATGAYAAAISTAAFATVLTAATNRVYARELSIIQETGEFSAVRRLRIQRLQWMLPALGIFLVVSLTYTEEILGLFHPTFVVEGTTAFRILAVTTSATVAMGIAPIFLKHRKQSRIIFPALVAAALVQVALLLVLVPRLEATGAAIAYAISMVGLYGYFTLASHWQMRALRTSSK
ncbi:lipopolysaccharide biosynthesis protein [Microbulbifer elongatus]|uniref:lipopolysaccharide biosynthesis protein n=1 Tax=Microbulbifer elongatus TaxID=86173 RepID=UPI001CFC7373|nr:hypothetical protein [Microbulbifer elongatus]